ncbi:MAG: high-potential iron-sulfur protein [Parvularculaceae bacterium]
MTKKRPSSVGAANTEKTTDRIVRREFLEGTAGLLIAAGIAAGGVQSAKAEDKADKADVSYQDSPNGGASCGGCKFYNGDGTCQIVAGDISENGWCTAFMAA